MVSCEHRILRVKSRRSRRSSPRVEAAVSRGRRIFERQYCVFGNFLGHPRVPQVASGCLRAPQDLKGRRKRRGRWGGVGEGEDRKKRIGRSERRSEVCRTMVHHACTLKGAADSMASPLPPTSSFPNLTVPNPTPPQPDRRLVFPMHFASVE